MLAQQLLCQPERVVELLRAAPDARAFLTGNGGYFTKHSALVLSGEPSAGRPGS